MAGMPQALPAGSALLLAGLFMLHSLLFIMSFECLDPSKCVKGYPEEPSCMKVLTNTVCARDVRCAGEEVILF